MPQARGRPLAPPPVRARFARKVLDAVKKIPRGRVSTYALVARQAGSPLAVRAAGTALAKNTALLRIPCHRVVRSDGSVGRYQLGSAKKRALLEAEGVRFDARGRVSGGNFYFGEKPWCVYILECRNGSLYTGVTTNLARRFREHQNKSARYTSYNPPVRIAYSEASPDRSSALKREARIKRLRRREKLALISR